jgi:hypothetical protein
MVQCKLFCTHTHTHTHSFLFNSQFPFYPSLAAGFPSLPLVSCLVAGIMHYAYALSSTYLLYYYYLPIGTHIVLQ